MFVEVKKEGRLEACVIGGVELGAKFIKSRLLVIFWRKEGLGVGNKGVAFAL